MNALQKFYIYKKAIDPTMKLTLERFHFFFKNELEKEWLKLNAPTPLSDEKTPLTTFRLTVKQTDIDGLNKNLPDSGKDHKVNALLSISDKNNTIYKIKLRYRGDGPYHWLFPQKSLRIQFGKNDTYYMAKKINLINPPEIINYKDEINYDLAKNLGLISPITKLCRVFINAKYMGVYFFITQVDESLLRYYKKMPGSIYYGDGSDIGSDGIANLWKDPKYWIKKASRNAEQQNNREDIDIFINYINANDKEFENFVETYVNKQKYFTFIAQDRAFGSHHHDYIHNHKIYFDPYKGKFEPIAWDLRYWLPNKQKDLSLYPLQLRLASIPKYDAQIDKITYNIIKDNFVDKIADKYENIINNMHQDILSDYNRDQGRIIQTISKSFVSVPFSIQDIRKRQKRDINNLKKRIQYLKNLYNTTNILYAIDKLDNNTTKLILVIDGESPVQMTLNENLENSLYCNKQVVRKSTVLYSSRKIVDHSQKYFRKKLYGTKTVQTFRQKYIFTIDKEMTETQIIHAMKFKNYITSKKLTLQKFDANTSIEKIKTAFIQNHIQKKVTLSGNIEVSKTMIFDKNTIVTIDPGTTFTIHAKSSIYFYGRVNAHGTKKHIITFKAKDPQKPWGIVAVQGHAASGSKFEYVSFDNGSVDTHNLIHYTAPFNIHDVKWFEVRHCKIGRNHIGDDSMHIAYAKGVVDSCKFNNARSDSLDIDISEVNITNSSFNHSGNDGLDIMTTILNASNNTFTDMGDKGISVGEWSEANITNTVFTRALIGLEVKDKSEVVAYSLTFIDSKKKAINLYNKNKRYNTGGFLKASHIKFIGNDKITADKRSKYEIQ